MANAYHQMYMPIFWALFKQNYVISVPHFQTQVRKRLHIRVTSIDVVDFFKEVEKTGYGKLVEHKVSRGPKWNAWSMNTKGFQCKMKTSEVK